jgi:hypothetical protein
MVRNDTLERRIAAVQNNAFSLSGVKNRSGSHMHLSRHFCMLVACCALM